jgi:hypothetical protein
MCQDKEPSPCEAALGNPNVPPFRGFESWHPVPTVQTVGYIVTSLRDFEQRKRRTPHIKKMVEIFYGADF